MRYFLIFCMCNLPPPSKKLNGSKLEHLRFSGMWNTILTLIVQCVMPDLEARFKVAALENWFVGRPRLDVVIRNPRVNVYITLENNHL